VTHSVPKRYALFENDDVLEREELESEATDVASDDRLGVGGYESFGVVDMLGMVIVLGNVLGRIGNRDDILVYPVRRWIVCFGRTEWRDLDGPISRSPESAYALELLPLRTTTRADKKVFPP
jgi:hypothetical protein